MRSENLLLVGSAILLAASYYTAKTNTVTAHTTPYAHSYARSYTKAERAEMTALVLKYTRPQRKESEAEKKRSKLPDPIKSAWDAAVNDEINNRTHNNDNAL